ncbi:MAG: lysine transporter LysE [Chitinophagaceae bacterium]|jgi:threonine/homoserine/homoserine lactone efflux protein|nr:lysine transporter LysE [Chitinophagaceae bacterium]
MKSTSLNKVFWVGMLVSFLGTLPLGTLNIAAMQISASDGLAPALKFALGSLVVEAIYVRVSLVAMDWVRKQKLLLKILEWVTLFIVVALAASSFYAALNPSVDENVILSSTIHRFFLGMMMCAVTPAQIPFWFGWSTVLFTKGILLPKASFYNIYILGIAIGTFAGNCIFIFGGRLMVDSLNASQSLLNWIIGGIFAATAIIQIWRIIKDKGTVHKIEHPEEMKEKVEKQIKEVDDTVS